MKAPPDDILTGQHDECSGLFVLSALGDADAAKELYSLCVPPLRSWLAQRVSYAIAEDAAHEALILAFQKNQRYRVGARFMPWLKAIGWNLAQNRLRNEMRRRSRELAYTKAESFHSQADPWPDERWRSALEACLATLPESQLQLIRSRYCEGRGNHSIAFSQGRTREAIAVAVHRICKTLRRETALLLQRMETMPDGVAP